MDVARTYSLCPPEHRPKLQLGSREPQLAQPRSTMPECGEQRLEALGSEHMGSPSKLLYPQSPVTQGMS